MRRLGQLSRAVFRRYDQRLAPITVPLFGNWNRLDLNVVHAVHHAVCRVIGMARRVDVTADAQRRHVDALARDGFCVVENALPPAVLHRLSSDAARLFADPSHCYKPGGLESFVTHVRESMRLVPHMTDVLTPEIVGILHGAFGSLFKVYFGTIYRTHVTERAPTKSWLWHSDNHPGPRLKIMAYLTDATAETGALRIIPRPATRELFSRGFRDRTDVAAFEDVLQDDSKHIVLEGRAGTVIVFDNNMIHKATAPVTGYRDVVMLQVLPSVIPWKQHLETSFDRVSATEDGYATNPFGA